MTATPTASDLLRQDTTLRDALSEALGIERERVASFNNDSGLFGALPEFDSMAVATLLTLIEEKFDTIIEDDDVEAEDFITYGSLLAFIRRKLG